MHGAGLLKDGGGIRFYMTAQTNATDLGSCADQLSENLLTLHELHLPQIEPVEVEHIECEIDEPVLAPTGQIVLQRVEVGNTSLVENNDFAVQDQLTVAELL